MKNLITATAAVLAGVWTLAPADAEQVSQIEQYGITWHFDKPVEAGQFITGDWWVIGPVDIARVTPEPGPVGTGSGDVAKSRYGDQGTEVDLRMRNGSMIVAEAGEGQGYDSRLKNYDPSMSIDFPKRLMPGTSLVSTISNEPLKVEVMYEAIMWRSEKTGDRALNTAAVLTVLNEQPPADAFRPPYAGREKPIYTFSQLNLDLLQNLPAPDSRPDWNQYARYLQRPWLDHTTSWLHQITGPSENQANYGREFTRITGIAALMINTKASPEQKRPLIIGLVQLGIDIHGVINAGREYYADGGHYSGRKLPAILAAALLGDKKMQHTASNARFAEDLQTYYGQGWAGQQALFQVVNLWGSRPPHEQKLPTEWDKNDKQAEMYRGVNSGAWPATALVIRLMGLVKAWDHDAFFDYNDRWMSPKDPYADQYPAGQQRSDKEGKAIDSFVNDMWQRFRTAAPSAEWAGDGQMWDAMHKPKPEWRSNPKPEEPAEVYLP